MPRTRTGVDREQKVGEILDAAEARLLSSGYEGMSIAAIARELGLAQNAIYWYFRSKDHLFVAVLRRLKERIGALRPGSRAGLVRQMLWAVDRMEEYRAIRLAISERARHSEVVTAFAPEFDGMLEDLVRDGLRPFVDAADLDTAVRSFQAAVQGAFVLDFARPERDRVLTFALRKLTGVGELRAGSAAGT